MGQNNWKSFYINANIFRSAKLANDDISCVLNILQMPQSTIQVAVKKFPEFRCNCLFHNKGRYLLNLLQIRIHQNTHINFAFFSLHETMMKILFRYLPKFGLRVCFYALYDVKPVTFEAYLFLRNSQKPESSKSGE